MKRNEWEVHGSMHHCFAACHVLLGEVVVCDIAVHALQLRVSEKPGVLLRHRLLSRRPRLRSQVPRPDCVAVSQQCLHDRPAGEARATTDEHTHSWAHD